MTRLITSAGFFFALISLTLSTAWAATKVGVIGAANPQVFVSRDGEQKQPLNIGDAIYLNDQLTTDGKGSAQLMFLDKSALTISPDSLVTIDKFVYDPTAKDGTMSLNGAKGAFRFIGGALTKKKAVNIKTPVSTIGIRGGIVDTFVDAGGKTDAVFLFGKEMSMTNASGQTTSTTQFGSGLGLADAGSMPVSLPQNVVAARINNSPTQAAVRAAPPAPAGQINAIENKVNTGASSKTENEGGSNGGDNAAPAGGSGNGGSDESNSSNSNDSSDTGNNDGAGTDSTNNNAVSADTGDDSAALGSGGSDASTGENTQAASSDVTSAEPAPAATSGGLAEGAGMKPMAEVASPALAVGNIGSEVAQENTILDTATTSDGNTTASGNIRDRARQNPDAIILTEREGRPGGTRPDGSNTNEAITPNRDALDNDAPLPPALVLPGNDDQRVPLDNDGDTTGDNTGNPPSSSGGSGQTNNAPIDNGNTLAGYNEHDHPNRIRPLTQTDLLTSIADPEGDGMSIDTSSIAVSDPQQAEIITSSGDPALKLKRDIAPGQMQTVTINYDVSDGTNVINVTRDITVTGQDIFGNDIAWDNAAPNMNAVPGRSGQYAMRSGSDTRSGRMQAYFNHTEGQYFGLGSDQSVNGAAVSVSGSNDEGEYYIATRGNAGEGSSLTPKADSFAVEVESGEYDISGQSGGNDGTVQWVETNNGSFYYAQQQWTENSQTHDMRYFHGDSNLLHDDYNAISDIQADYTALLSDSAAHAASSTTNTIPIINYSFLPDLFGDYNSAGNDEFGFMYHNAYAGFGGADSGAMPNAENRYGLLVDYSAKKYFSGYVNFAGNAGFGSEMIAAFGNIRSTPSFTLNGTSLDYHTNAFEGVAFEWSQDDLDMSGTTQANEILGDSGDSYIKARELFNDTTTANSAVNALVLRGHSHTNADDMAQAAIADTKADTLEHFDTTAGSMNMNGYTAGLIHQDDGTNHGTARIAGDVDVYIPGGTKDVGASVYYTLKDTAVDASGTSEVRYMGTNGSGPSAAIQQDMYAASDAMDDNIMIAPGSNAQQAVCSSCEFGHWGVWSTGFDNSGTQNMSGLVPYVAGTKTPYTPGTAAPGDWNYDANADGIYDIGDGPGILGTVTYNGAATANMAITPDGGATELINAVGTMNAQIDLANRKIFATQMDVNFNNIGGEASRSLAITNDAVMHFDGSTNTFGGSIDRTFVDKHGTSTGSGLGGHMKGALYGPNAEEVGGSFYTEADTGAGGENIKAGGVYLGNRNSP